MDGMSEAQGKAANDRYYTVAKLIERLKTFPGDAFIEVESEGHGIAVDTVELTEEGGVYIG